MKLGTQHLFLLSDPSVVRDLLEKKSGNYSCRPDIYARYFGDNLNIALRDNDDIWRRQRKMYHVRLNVKSADNYVPYQEFDKLQLLFDLSTQPQRWVGHIERYAASISSTILYGWRTPQTGTGYVKDLLEWMDMTSDAINFQLVDFYPSLRQFYHMIPYWMLPSKKKLHELKNLEDRLFWDLFNRVKDKLATGKAYPSFIRDMMADTGSDRLSDRHMANNAAHGFGAATDTTANTTLGFIKAMVLFPEVQEKARQELDAVIGNGRLPNWDDRKDLPYIRGIVEETLRWAPSPISAAIPHAAKADDIYNGMEIPKGSMMMINVWALNHERYKDSRNFDPMRQSAESTLIEQNSINQDSSKRLHFTFGAGRRVCPGFHVAQRSLFLAISGILWGFTIKRARDANGNFTVINRDAVSPGMVVRPEEFECVIEPRDPARKALIHEEWGKAEKHLDSEGNFTEEFIQGLAKN
ncbi:hypothetical protein ACJZ2D_003359 [Fusarium nematophilum]